ncbi:unnamed protein product [Adineta steineri]|uniref:F-box domain-containing protein n=1 Tax=Adineta steineri TaxID=433720 RepID=A0A819SV50_9BILA|nr:unnamed protein product [Adineta steineri]
MKDFLVQLDDLPGEILMYIFKKLCSYEVLYYLMDVNQRINRIARDRIFTHHLCLLEYCRIDDSSIPLSGPILDRFCSKILPEIGHQIETLYLERTSIERVLRATNYPNLNNLGLCDIDDDKLVMSLFSDTNSVIHLFNNQISSLVISFNEKINSCLKFNPYSPVRGTLFLGMTLETAISSTLLELHINVSDMTDFNHILDGRFDQLRILYINIDSIGIYYPYKELNKNLLPNLRIFSLYGFCVTCIQHFNELLVPFLCRMINLDELDLHINVLCYEKVIDGDILKKDIMIHMARLYKFTFNIRSTIKHRNQTNFSLNESIAKTFNNFSNDQIITGIDHFERYSKCRIYSCPYQWRMYDDITNNFRDGLFTNVTQVSLYDEHPFEDEFFLRISKSFPFMKQLKIHNLKAQQNKSNNDNQILSTIKYPNLTRLDLLHTHDDYIELFLFNMKMSLPNNLHLRGRYQSLKRVTQNFTRYITENNCTKLAALYILIVNQTDEYHIKKYFPYICIHNTGDFLLSK